MKKTWLIALITIALGMASCSGGDDDKEPTYYTVTFDADGGTPTPAVQRVEAGKTASAPTNPSKSGYVFKSWQLSGSGTVYNFQTPITSNITLQAKWEEEAKVEYWQVTWQLNGGTWPSTGDNHATQVVKGGTLAEPAAPTKANATFEGWHKEAELTNKITFPYDVSAATSDFTLYAKWKDEGGGQEGDYKMFTSIAALSTWLGSQAANTAETAYKVGLKSVNMDSGNNWGDLGIAIGETNKTKYINLDLSGCTGTTIPDGKAVSNSGKVTYYGAFINCDNLVAIKLSADLTTIGAYAFRSCENLVSVTLPTTVKSIHNYAFATCYKLESINLPDGLQTIGHNGFYLCNLKSAVIPKGITKIEEDTFNGCDLTSATLPENLQSIGRWAFQSNQNLTSIIIPANVKSISGATLAKCKSLTKVIVQAVTPPDMIIGFEGDVFAETHSSLKIYVPAESVEAYKSATGWKEHADKIVANTD